MVAFYRSHGACLSGGSLQRSPGAELDRRGDPSRHHPGLRLHRHPPPLGPPALLSHRRRDTDGRELPLAGEPAAALLRGGEEVTGASPGRTAAFPKGRSMLSEPPGESSCRDGDRAKRVGRDGKVTGRFPPLPEKDPLPGSRRISRWRAISGRTGCDNCHRPAKDRGGALLVPHERRQLQDTVVERILL